jgi:endoglycosylceramidase
LFIWKAIEPYPNDNLDELLPEGKKYLSSMRRIIDLLYEYGLYVIIDFHQDISHEVFGGDGFPDWALALDGKHKNPKPATMRDKKWQIAYMTNKLQRHTLESFWNNDLTNRESDL